MAAKTYLSSAETVFVSQLTERQINRVVDEELVPAGLLWLKEGARLFSRLAAGFARFYFDTEDTLAAAARRDVLRVLFDRVGLLDHGQQESVIHLSAFPMNVDWVVRMKNIVEVDMATYVADAHSRAKEVDLAASLVSMDPEVMSGVPCFAGTRVPIDVVLASIDAGDTMDRVVASYPFLTEAHLAAARVHNQVRPRRGRPRKLGEQNPGWVPRKSTTVRSPNR